MNVITVDPVAPMRDSTTPKSSNTIATPNEPSK